MAVARHNKVANTMPIHIEGAVAPAAACPAKVSHRNAPGAISAIAFIVRPVSPTVGFISAELSAIGVLLVSANLRFLLNHIVSEHEPEFSHRPRLVLVHAAATEGVSRRDIARMNISEVSANEEAATLEGGRDRDRCGSTARAVHQIDSFVRGA